MGEKQGTREAIERMTGRLIQGGTSPDRARQIARDAAIRRETGKPSRLAQKVIESGNHPTGGK